MNYVIFDVFSLSSMGDIQVEIQGCKACEKYCAEDRDLRIPQRINGN